MQSDEACKNVGTEQAKQDVRILASLSAETANKVFDCLEARDAFPRFDQPDLIEVDNVSEDCGYTLGSALSLLWLFVNRRAGHTEDAEALYRDLKEMGIVEDDERSRETLKVVLSRLQALARRLRFRRPGRNADEAGT